MPISFGATALMSQTNGIKGEMVVTLKKQQYYLWRDVDSEGNVLDVLLQRQRSTKAAERFFRKLLKKQGFTPRVIVTDKLKSYAAAKKQVLKGVEHRYSQELEQPSGKLSSADTSARATNAEVQIPRTSATISICIWTDSLTTFTPNNINLQHDAIDNNSASDFKIGEKLLI